MTPAAVLAILVATGEAQAVPTTAMAAAAAEVIGEPRGVRVVEAGALSDDEARRVERALGVRAVVALAWSDVEHRRARLRLHAARTDRWIDRAVDFAAGDTPAERGRALGFAMASMLPEGDPTLPLATSAEPPAPPSPAAPLGASALEVSFVAATGLGGPAGGAGARLGFARFVSERAAFGLSLSARRGRIDTLDAPEVTASAGAGGAFWPLPPARARRLAVAVRVEALLVVEAVGRTDASGASAWKGHALPGGELALVGALRLTGPLEAFAAAGLEGTTGTTDVTVLAAQGSGRATIPRARADVDLGLTLRF